MLFGSPSIPGLHYSSCGKAELSQMCNHRILWFLIFTLIWPKENFIDCKQLWNHLISIEQSMELLFFFSLQRIISYFRKCQCVNKCLKKRTWVRAPFVSKVSLHFPHTFSLLLDIYLRQRELQAVCTMKLAGGNLSFSHTIVPLEYKLWKQLIW